jgi:hypothetical protein
MLRFFKPDFSLFLIPLTAVEYISKLDRRSLQMVERFEGWRLETEDW